MCKNIKTIQICFCNFWDKFSYKKTFHVFYYFKSIGYKVGTFKLNIQQF